MSKKSSFAFVKKDFPGLERVIDENGKRVWKFDGKTFDTKREVYLYKYPPQTKIELPTSKPAIAEAGSPA
jgi:hypothetical protein